MPSIEAAIYAYLQTQSDLTDLLADGQIYPLWLPATATLPAVSYRRMTGGYGHRIDGAADWSQPTFQFDVWADTYSDMHAIAVELRSNLDGMAGTLGGLRIGSITNQTEIDLYEQPQHGESKGTHHRAIRYLILHAQTLPTDVSGDLGLACDSDLEPSLVAYLQTKLADLIEDRLYPSYIPQHISQRPAIVFRRASGGYAHWLSGSADWAMPDIELEIIGDRFSECVEVAERLRNVLDGYSGKMGCAKIGAAILTDRTDSTIKPTHGETSGGYSITLSFAICYTTKVQCGFSSGFSSAFC